MTDEEINEKYIKAEALIKKWRGCKTIKDVSTEINQLNCIIDLTLFKNVLIQNGYFSLNEIDKIHSLMKEQSEIIGIQFNIDN